MSNFKHGHDQAATCPETAKIRYSGFTEANRAAQRMNRRYQERGSRANHAFKCRYCDGYHVGHRADAVRKRKFRW